MDDFTRRRGMETRAWTPSRVIGYIAYHREGSGVAVHAFRISLLPNHAQGLFLTTLHAVSKCTFEIAEAYPTRSLTIVCFRP